MLLTDRNGNRKVDGVSNSESKMSTISQYMLGPCSFELQMSPGFNGKSRYLHSSCLLKIKARYRRWVRNNLKRLVTGTV